VARTEAKLVALEWRVRDGLLADPGKIGRAAQRILGASGVGRLFDVEIGPGRFLYHYNDQAFAYEEQLAGHYVLTTSLTPVEASTVQVVTAYQQLQHIEQRFRVLKDFLHLRPVRHWTEQRVRGHIAICVYASILEALIANDLRAGDVRDPDLAEQQLSAARALRQLARIRAVTLDAGGRSVNIVTRRAPLQAAILSALHVDTTSWARAHIT
jgi:transposase